MISEETTSIEEEGSPIEATTKNNTTIEQDFILPSRGLIYNKKIDPHITLKSMTVRDEMKRNNPATEGTANQQLARLIDSCLATKLPISSYNMCMGDFLYLVVKLRTVTYDSTYRITATCNGCFQDGVYDVDLDTLEQNVLKEEDLGEENPNDPRNILKVYLPRCQKEVELHYNTPQILDKIEEKCKEEEEDYRRRNQVASSADWHEFWQLYYAIKTVDGMTMDSEEKEDFINHMEQFDALLIQIALDEFDKKVGLGVTFNVHCNHCGKELKIPFRFTREFWRPTHISAKRTGGDDSLRDL